MAQAVLEDTGVIHADGVIPDDVRDDRRPRLRPRRRIWRWVVLAGAAAFAVVVVAVWTLPLSSETLREKLVAALSERFESDVELASLKVRVFPTFHADGSGLVIRHKSRRDVPPLIKIAQLSVDSGLSQLFRKHVGRVVVTGLEINIPPGGDDESSAGTREPADAAGGDAPNDQMSMKDIVVDQLITTNARLVIIPQKKDKSPKTWQIHDLRMQSVSFATRMPFEATLTNAVPPGEIDVKGSFGPWHSRIPGASPLEGTFTFTDADLSVFKGISGILSAHGDFGGTLGRIVVHGQTDTPDFTVAVGGHPVPLHVDYHTTVDGTNGDTLLDRIDASFLKTSFVAKGSVVETPGRKGRTIALDVVMDQARIEDLLRLAVKAPKPPLTGAIKLKTRFVLPPGERDVVDKLSLDGQFAIATAKFTSIDIQKKVDELSRRSRGKTEDGGEQSVVSNFRGVFTLSGGSLLLRPLTFDTPGTSVQLTGSYKLRPEMMSFKGTLLMDAAISETQKGWKRLVLKVIDPIFAKKGGGGSAIPIKIEGKRSDPAFGIDKGALLKR